MPVFPSKLAVISNSEVKLGNELLSLITANGFEINSNKLRLQTSNRHQEVTGITVNKILNVNRRHIRKIRAMLHFWKLYGPELAEKRHISGRMKYRNPEKINSIKFKKVLRGKIEFIGMVKGKDDFVYKKLLLRYFDLVKRDIKQKIVERKSVTAFISYSRIDESFARKLSTSLSSNNIGVWIDIDHIPLGMNWSNEVQKGLDICTVLLLIVSPSSMASEIVTKEWQYCIDEKKRVIPLIWQHAKRHFEINRLQYIDFQLEENYTDNFNQLKNALLNSASNIRSSSGTED